MTSNEVWFIIIATAALTWVIKIVNGITAPRKNIPKPPSSNLPAFRIDKHRQLRVAMEQYLARDPKDFGALLFTREQTDEICDKIVGYREDAKKHGKRSNT